MSIFTLGPAGSYSHLAARKIFANQHIEFKQTISEVFEAIQKNKDAQAIVPLENLIEGTVRETLDQLLETDLYINDIFVLPIEHCLASQNNKFKIIVSHEQALAQCRKTIQKNYKKLKTQAVSSTSEACQLALESEHYAAICSPLASEIYDLTIQQSNFSDYQKNETKFAVISNKPNSKTNITTIAALTPIDPDQPGLLVKMLFPFQENGVNLTKIESRPNKKNPNQHIFFIQFEGDARQARARKILTYLDKDLQICKAKIFGGQATKDNYLV
jgi:prephenate dehydratase